jgi:uncharacterized protein YxjI
MFHLTKYFVREHVGLLKLTDTFDIIDPQTNQQIGIAQENPGTFFKFLRLLVNKKLLPTAVEIKPNEQAAPLLTIRRGATFLRAKVRVLDQQGQELGYFKSKVFSLGGGFYVFDKNDNQVAEVKGDWKGWNFKMVDSSGRELGTITKKWAGIGRELFTSADNYIIALDDKLQQNPAIVALLLAAGLAIDVVFKERG